MTERKKYPCPVPEEMVKYYDLGLEARRLFADTFQLERVRTQELLARYLPRPPAVILDVGGGPGFYACWLAQNGYEVHLVDPVPLHVDQAAQASRSQRASPLASVCLGDARELAWSDASADGVLLLGPLYHLTERAERLKALREARRVMREGGVLVAAAISRFASLLGGLVRGFIHDPEYAVIVERDLQDGQHKNPTDHSEYFTTAFLHLPEDLSAEVAEAGLHHEKTFAVEGPGWLLQNFKDYWSDPARRTRLLDAVRSMEEEPSVLGVSAHLLTVARKTA